MLWLNDKQLFAMTISDLQIQRGQAFNLVFSTQMDSAVYLVLMRKWANDLVLMRKRAMQYI